MAVVTPIDRPKSVSNGVVIEVFGGVFVFALIFEFSVGIGFFVIELSHISFLFSWNYKCALCDIRCIRTRTERKQENLSSGRKCSPGKEYIHCYQHPATLNRIINEIDNSEQLYGNKSYFVIFGSIFISCNVYIEWIQNLSHILFWWWF